MNEYIDIQFHKNNRPLRVRRQVPGGIEFEETDPIQRSVYVGFDAADDITEYRMRRIRQLHGWDATQFKLNITVEDGSLVLRGVDQFALPEGRYTLRVDVEEAKTRLRKRTIDLRDDGHVEGVVDVTTDDRQIAVDLTACDAAIATVLDASSFDGQAARSWLASDHRATRKACVLNLLASLRVRPSVADPLIGEVQQFFWSGLERAYARVDRDLLTRLESLSIDPKKPFYREGHPTSPMHLQLLEMIPEPADIKAQFTPETLLSFRGEGNPSLQVVISAPPGLAYGYADFDLDLGNPLQDVAGFAVHMSELLGSGLTNHLDLRKGLARTSAGAYLYYKLAAA